MNTGLPRLNLAARLFVTACNGIAPFGATPARDDRILKYCLSPVSGGRNDNFSSYIVRETESRLLRKKDARLACNRTHLQWILEDRTDSLNVSTIEDYV